MALSDPQTITIDGAANSLPRTGMTGNSGTFAKADATRTLEIRHSSGSRFRHVIKLYDTKVVSNALVPSQNQAVNMSAHFVVDIPKNGYTVDEAAKIAAGLAAWFTVGNLTKVLAGES